MQTLSLSVRTAVVLLALAVGPAAAQPPATPASQTRMGVRAAFIVDLDSIAASQSFDAVLGSAQLTAFGGGGDVLNVWRGLFGRVAVSRAKKTGERALVFGGRTIPLGVPIDVSYTPIEIGAGWRFASAVGRRLTPYAGGGVLVLRYAERSPYAASGDDVSLSKTGYMAFGGVEIPVAKHFVVGGETQYRSVPDAIGAGGVSQDFNESDLGGFTVRVLFGFRR